MVSRPGDLDHQDAHAAQAQGCAAAASTVDGHAAAHRTRSAWEARAELQGARARAGLCVQCGDPAHWTLCGDCEADARRDLECY